MIESPGFNCTLAPWNAVSELLTLDLQNAYTAQCTIRNDTSYAIAFQEMAKWDAIFLKDAHERLADMMEGYNLSIKDVKDFVRCISLIHSQTLADRFRWRCARTK